ncbi:response regulator [Paenibacillus sp. sgz302251]|uniref:response regulator n=1 Tax=Paenibacillus sp. sgz302251 TaxID=3414493 RepID=UPI003C7BF1C8
MFKVMLVDDEMIVRQGIMTSIDWAEHGIEIASEAKNGKEALEKLKNEKVDLVVTDIRMPVMTGIELARLIKTEMPEIEVVMLSGYEDFHYAKEAMSIGIKEYLLKPIMADKLVETIAQIRDQQQEKRSVQENESIRNQIFNENIPFIKSKLMNSLINKKSDTNESIDKAKTLKVDLSGPAYHIFVIDIDDFLLFTERSSQKEKDAYKFAVLNIAEETLISCLPGFVCYGDMDKMIGLINAERDASIIGVCEEIQFNIQKYLKLSVTIGIGRPSLNILEIDRAYAEAALAVQQKAFQGKGKIIMFNKEQEQLLSSGNSVIFFTDEEKELIHHLKTLNTDGVREMMNKYFVCFTAENLSFNKIKGLCIRLITSVTQTIEEMGISAEQLLGTGFIPHVEVEKYEVLTDLITWINEMMEGILALIQENSNHNARKIVKEAILYVSKHYDKEISLTEVADHVYVTPAHFSKVFKQEMGVTFIKWLNQYRVEEAKKLLKNTWLKTYEIAEKVGYQDYKYFSIIFKKHTGCSPRDFRNQ